MNRSYYCVVFAVAILLLGCRNRSATPAAIAQTLPVIEVERFPGFVPPKTFQQRHYRFTLAANGAWKYIPEQANLGKIGTLSAAQVNDWVQGLEKTGYRQLDSSKKLGETDQEYLHITLRTQNQMVVVEIMPPAPSAAFLQKKIAMLVNLPQ